MQPAPRAKFGQTTIEFRNHIMYYILTMQLTKYLGEGCRFICASKLAIQRSKAQMSALCPFFSVHWLHCTCSHFLCTIHAHKFLAILYI